MIDAGIGRRSARCPRVARSKTLTAAREMESGDGTRGAGSVTEGTGSRSIGGPAQTLPRRARAHAGPGEDEARERVGTFDLRAVTAVGEDLEPGVRDRGED